MRVVPGGFRPDHLLVHYDEVGLKGRNRRWFEDMLARSMRRALRAAGLMWDVRRLYGRMVVDLGAGGGDWPEAAETLSRVFGVAYLLPVRRLEPDPGAIGRAAAEVLQGEARQRTFAVQCKRAAKELPFTSMDLQREVGRRVQEATGWSVDLERPECVVRVECVNKVAFLGFGRYSGPGGLPTGVAGKVVCLLSGGIDSPVAAYRLLRRGATAVYAHFHSHPYTSAESQEKVRELVERIQPPGTKARVHMLAFAEVQRAIAARCRAPLRVILYRRFMLRTAEWIARREGGLALVTGENLGQVASQTLENLSAIEAAVALPVLRPLVGLDKLEIIEEAKRAGTFSISIEPHDDCCSFLLPPNPATYSRSVELEEEERRAFDIQREVETLVASSHVVEVEGWTRPRAAGAVESRRP